MLPADRPAVVIARRADEDLHVRVGDRVTVRYPVPTGPRSYQLVSATIPITGIHTSPLRFLAYSLPPPGTPQPTSNGSSGRRRRSSRRRLGPLSQFTQVLVITVAIIGTFATILGVAGGYAILRWIIDVSMRSTMPDLGTLISISASTYGLAALAGILSVSAAPLLTLRRLRRTDVPLALRVVE